MVFRYSLKWLLVAFVYVAFAAIAFGRGSWLYGNLLWGAGWTAWVSAVWVTISGTGTAQKRAAGFVLFSGAFALATFFVPQSLPTARVLSALGASDPEQAMSVAVVTTDAAPRAADAAPLPPVRGTVFSAQGDSLWEPQLHAASAVGVTIAGLVGYLLASSVESIRAKAKAPSKVATAALTLAIATQASLARAETEGITYVDATHGASGNTRLDNGDVFTPVATAALGNDNNWSLRPFGNGGTVYTSNDGRPAGPENAPPLVTTISGLTPGESYLVYAFFWSDHHNWHLQASLKRDLRDVEATALRTAAANQKAAAATVDEFGNDVVVSEANRTLQLAPLGKAVASAKGEIEIWVDDIPNASSATRTWYDGVGYVQVQPLRLPNSAEVLKWLPAVVLGMVAVFGSAAYLLGRKKRPSPDNAEAP